MKNAGAAYDPASMTRRLLLCAFLLLASRSGAHAACNIIPPAEQAYPSTLGSVTSPVTTVGETVEIRLTGCDGTTFDSTPANDQVAITFLPAGPGQPAPVIVPTGSVTVPDATTLRFTMPSTPNLAGPAEVTVTVAATTVADVGPLFAAHEVGSTCDKQPETVFEQFTVLPPPNHFGDVVNGVATQVLATLDGSGSLVIPFDYRQVLPLGPGEPVARLLTGTTTLDAFPATPGVQPIDVPTSYVRSFTIDGRPLPPLLRATDAGNQIFGATDGAVALIRVARDGDQGVKFDLASDRTNGGYGPIVVPNSEYTVATSAAIPLENLHSTASGVAFARNEQIEGDLNGDTDTNDQVVQIVDVGTFQSTNTGMAASATHNPIVGGAALDVSTSLAAFLESEASQGNADLNGDGDTLDDVLRVFSLNATQLTPSATLVGDPFPGVSRKPVAISGSLVYYREPLPGFDGGPGVGGLVDLVVSPDGHYLYEVSTGTVGGLLAGHHLDSETGGEQRDITSINLQGGLDGATGIAVSPDSQFLFVALPSQNAIEALGVSYDPVGKATVTQHPHTTATGLNGVSSLAVSPDGKHLYTVAAGDDAVDTFSIDPGTGNLTFVATIQNGVGGVTNLVDPVRVAVSAEGKNVYVAAKGSSALKVFTRNATTGVLTQLETDLDGGTGGPSLGGIDDVTVSPDGANVYAMSDTDSALSIFTRNPATGALTFSTALTNGVGGITGLNQGARVIVSPDNAAVYASTLFGNFLAFSRQMPGGALTFTGSSGFGFGSPIASSNIAISPDSEHIYQNLNEFGNGQTFVRRGTLRAFDAVAGALVAGLDGSLDTPLAAVGGGRAVFTTAGGARLYDPATDTVSIIGGGLFPSKIAVSNTLIAMLVSEASLGVDANRDGDTNDNALVVASPTNPGAPAKIVGIGADDVAVTDLCLGGTNGGLPCATDGDCGGGTCRGIAVVTANEDAYKDSGENPHPPSADFNHNGTVGDTEVLFLYDDGTGQLTDIGWQAYDFLVGGHILAFRTAETEALRDLNGNFAADDIVMMFYDLAANVIVNPEKAAVKCELPGCTPGLPYKIIGDAVSFLVPESIQGPNDTPVDLDGNGHTDDIVVVVYTIPEATTQVLASASLNGTLLVPSKPLGGLPPTLPTTFTDGTIVYKQVRESDIGRDVNEDGDMDDVVTLVDGDSDGDGVLDSQDGCPETPNPDQRDSDGDGLQDACDPNPY